MKRHLNSLLQRKLADFSEARSGGRRRPASTVAKAEMIGIKDGYDWLTRIKRESNRVAH